MRTRRGVRRLLPALAILVLAAPAGAQIVDFLGTWEWAYTRHPDGTLDTWSTVGYRQQVEFAPDGTYRRYVDEQLVVEDVWYLGRVIVWPCCIEYLGSELGSCGWWTEPGDVTWLHLQTGLWCPGGDQPPPERTETALFLRGPVPAAASSWGRVKSLYR